MRIDLPEPDLLWARWALFASALTALGYDDVYWCDADGAHHDDHGGNWARLVRVDGGRAVLFGYDHEYSDTVGATPPIDLLAGAPGWLPWPELLRHVAADQLGYLYWYDHGWSRVAYPAGAADGLTATAGSVLDADPARRELLDVVSEWGEHDLDDPAERDDVTRAAERLLAAAEARTLDRAVLAALLGRLRHRPADLAAGLAVATAAGLTPGSTPPTTPTPDAVPPRRVRTLSVDQHEKLVHTAMHEATERRRPAGPPTVELTALVDRVRAHAPAADGHCVLLVEATDDSLRVIRGSKPPSGLGGGDFDTFREVTDLVRRLRSAEAHPEHGRWFFLRLETGSDGYAVDRRYDSWPDWVPSDTYALLSLDALRNEVGRRTPDFRPEWSPLLEPEVAWREVLPGTAGD